MLCLIAGVLLVPAGIGFVAKFVHSLHTLSTKADGGFTIVPIMNYVLVTAGFVCLFLWAVARGMFRDIEKPKYTMLEREEQLEQGDCSIRRH